MIKQRVVETNEGIQDAVSVEVYDEMLKNLRDKGFMETKSIVKSGIRDGNVLEIGPGPGYLGLEWLKMTENTSLTGIEISNAMIEKAQQNAGIYGLADRVRFTPGNAMNLPFDDDAFDAVFSNGSLHEWEQPEKVFDEIARVVKPGGRFFISDLKRDMNFLIKWMMYLTTKPKSIRYGLISSINAAYTKQELEEILGSTNLKDARVDSSPFGVEITGYVS